MLTSVLRGQMYAFKSVSILMDHTHVFVETATELTRMGTAAQVNITRLSQQLPRLVNEFMNNTLPDIDECSEGIYNCEQNCHNSIGSYACSCNSGYRLDGNGVTCSGKSAAECAVAALHYNCFMFRY